jgi:hypothetical protein
VFGISWLLEERPLRDSTTLNASPRNPGGGHDTVLALD